MMATTKTMKATTMKARANRIGNNAMKNVETTMSEMTDYATHYARQNPGHAALICLGMGFILGWKLKI